MSDFDRLLDEAITVSTEGWDLDRLGCRLAITPPPWDYRAMVAEHAGDALTMLDMGTGGGEWLATLPARPSQTLATECWPPNVSVAARRLAPLGVVLVQAEGARDNQDQRLDETVGRLPFRDDAIDLISNRHESFLSSEVARILRTGGVFVTEQVGSGSYDDLHELLDLPAPTPGRWGLSLAIEQLAGVGLQVMASGSGFERATFADVGALAWYLRQVPWAAPGFDVDRNRTRLRAAHARMPATISLPSFWLVALR